MKSREIRIFSRDLKKMAKSLCATLAFLGLVNLFFLPFIHFHPENVHTHPGEIDTHHHAGHFHSHELENIAHWASIHPDDPEADEPLHHSHSSTEHDSDKVEYHTLALHTFDKNSILVKTETAATPNSFPENFQTFSVPGQPVALPAVFQHHRLRQVRGPPLAC